MGVWGFIAFVFVIAGTYLFISSIAAIYMNISLGQALALVLKKVKKLAVDCIKTYNQKPPQYLPVFLGECPYNWGDATFKQEEQAISKLSSIFGKLDLMHRFCDEDYVYYEIALEHIEEKFKMIDVKNLITDIISKQLFIQTRQHGCTVHNIEKYVFVEPVKDGNNYYVIVMIARHSGVVNKLNPKIQEVKK